MENEAHEYSAEGHMTVPGIEEIVRAMHASGDGNPDGIGATEAMEIFETYPEARDLLVKGDTILGSEKAQRAAYLFKQLALEKATPDEKTEFELLIEEFYAHIQSTT